MLDSQLSTSRVWGVWTDDYPKPETNEGILAEDLVNQMTLSDEAGRCTISDARVHPYF